MSTLVIYTLTTCEVCDKARAALTEQGAAFEERVLDDREDLQEEVIALTKQYTVPVLAHPDGTVEVGFAGEMG